MYTRFIPQGVQHGYTSGCTTRVYLRVCNRCIYGVCNRCIYGVCNSGVCAGCATVVYVRGVQRWVCAGCTTAGMCRVCTTVGMRRIEPPYDHERDMRRIEPSILPRWSMLRKLLLLLYPFHCWLII